MNTKRKEKYRQYMVKYREGKDVIQCFAPTGLRNEFKAVCANNDKTMREVLLNFVYAYVKGNK